MFANLYRNKPFFFLLVFAGCFALFILGLGIYVFFPSSSTPNTNSSRKQISLETNKYPAVTAITPEEYVLLTPGTTPTFSIQFHDQIDVTKLHATLTQAPISMPDKTRQVTLRTQYNNANHMLSVTTGSVIIPLSAYTLTIQGQTNDDIFLNVTYHSNDVAPTKVPTNNLSLKQYLPYETTTYALSYNEGRNMYVFNFKYDPTQHIPIAQQFQNAKAEAEQFIKSKGINLNSIVIDWRRS